MGKIEVNGMQFYAYHGCMEEEAKLGGKYIIDVCVNADLEPSAISDELKDTVDYVRIYTICKEEMGFRSKLIETVARRIAIKLKAIKGVTSGTITLKKLNAPIGGIIDHVSVSYSF